MVLLFFLVDTPGFNFSPVRAGRQSDFSHLTMNYKEKKIIKLVAEPFKFLVQNSFGLFLFNNMFDNGISMIDGHRNRPTIIIYNIAGQI